METKLIESESFKSFASRLQSEKSLRQNACKNVLSFGINFFDKLLGGILPTDLILIGAKTGAGKSELAVSIAKNVAKSGKNVHLFALEAEDCEVERRIKFQAIAKLYKAQSGVREINFQDWYLGKYDFLLPFEEAAELELQSYTNLFTFYRDSKFDLKKFQRMFRSLDGRSDLVIIDHLHYFDFESDNENKEIAELMKAIKDMSQLQKVPVILIAHLRKITKLERTLIPAIEDFHGSSNISKIATRTIIMSSGGIDQQSQKSITYVQTSKNRLAGERTKVVAKMLFNPSLNAYDEKFELGILSEDEKQFVAFTSELQKPNWLR